MRLEMNVDRPIEENKHIAQFQCVVVLWEVCVLCQSWVMQTASEWAYKWRSTNIVYVYILTLQVHVPVTQCSPGPGWWWAHPGPGSHSSDKTSLPEPDGWSKTPTPRHKRNLLIKQKNPHKLQFLDVFIALAYIMIYYKCFSSHWLMC